METISRFIERIRSGNTNREMSLVLSAIKDRIVTDEIPNICVFSLTERNDLLSQWRGYCSYQNGCSIGFATDKLLDLCSPYGFSLYPCVYKADEQEIVFTRIINLAIEKYLKNPTEVGLKDCKSFFWSYLRVLAPMIKNEAFEEEAEWRLVSRPIKNTDELYNFRIGDSMITPYYNLELAKPQSELPIRKIVVGPNPNSDMVVDALWDIKSHYGLENCEISKSKIPYRKC